MSDSAATPARTQTAEATAAAHVPRAPEGPAAARPSADLQERMEGLRAWLAQLDRKLGLRTYVGAAIAVLTLAAAVVALVLVLSLRQDAATEDDVQALRDEISSVEQSASQAADSRVSALEQRLDDLEDEVNRISTAQSTSRRELEVIQDDIRELASRRLGRRKRAGWRDVRLPAVDERGRASCADQHVACLHASDQSSTVARKSSGRARDRSRPSARIQSAAPERRSTQMPTGYCVKERKKVEIQNPTQVTMKNGRPAIQGTCPDCGTKIFKIGKL